MVKVAVGTYTGVQSRPSPPGYLGTSVITQVVYVSKTVTIRGGYTTTNGFADPPDPVINQTVLDAQGQGRVLFVAGDISPTIEGLHITGGNARGLEGGSPFNIDAGGGACIYTATATIRDCVVYSNTASTAKPGLGGGLYYWRSDATLSDSTVAGNVASTASSGNGGGVVLALGDVTLVNNLFADNIASTAGYGIGGGVYGHGTLIDNVIVDNTASTAGEGYGGGVSTGGSSVTLIGNTITGNAASTAGLGQGGGVYILETNLFTLTNNLVADNHANTQGSGLWFDGDASGTGPNMGQLLHTTIVNNHGSGQGVFVGDLTTLAFTSTIIAGHQTWGIYASSNSTVTLEATLWGSGDWANGIDWGGTGILITGTVNVWGDLSFVDPAVWDYHLAPGSDAIDAGVNAGVAADRDGTPRPQGSGYDIGAYEFRGIYLPLLLRNR